MSTQDWYEQLNKPSWAPPAGVFGAVWTPLYVAIVVSYGAVFVKAFSGRIPWAVAALFAVNLLANALFTPIQFGLRNNWLALADIVVVLITLVWALVAVWPYARWVTLVNVPQVAWVTFATVLQASIAWLNR